MIITNNTTCLLLSIKDNLYCGIKIAVVPVILKEIDITYFPIYNRRMYQYSAYHNHSNIIYEGAIEEFRKITTFWFDDYETSRDEKIKHYYDNCSGTHYFLSRDKQTIKKMVHNKLFRWKQKKLLKTPDFDFTQINFTYKQIICDLKHARV